MAKTAKKATKKPVSKTTTHIAEHGVTRMLNDAGLSAYQGGGNNNPNNTQVLMRKAGIKPVLTLPHPRGESRIYLVSDIEAYIEANRPKPQVQVQAKPAKDAALAPTMSNAQFKELNDQLADLRADLGNLTQMMHSLLELWSPVRDDPRDQPIHSESAAGPAVNGHDPQESVAH